MVVAVGVVSEQVAIEFLFKVSKQDILMHCMWV